MGWVTIGWVLSEGAFNGENGSAFRKRITMKLNVGSSDMRRNSLIEKLFGSFWEVLKENSALEEWWTHGECDVITIQHLFKCITRKDTPWTASLSRVPSGSLAGLLQTYSNEAERKREGLNNYVHITNVYLLFCL